MTEQLTSFFSLFFSAENQLITMFFSGLLSSTILPGNSEVIFTTIASQHIIADSSFYSSSLMALLLIATVGNSLGSLITYAMGLLVPKPTQAKNRYTRWALAKSEKYGVIVLLFSWLPIVGDIFCGIAGWLRFSLWQSVILIVIGKLLRYLFLLATLYSVLKYVL
ncbi:DedA family protein [Mannheimia sp. AT1]|uniref:DedA family protein n=1 Tax=Mannheimia cairinae TaxID=3025936 RepID=A0ABT5MP65_9PAST|nr:YqaA family protein [Mannheimia cairinae]MDD0823960.1 DedA family protein [Mannheimia cairinae]MDD0825276.1 DedA family protein [Mannheimia cairinae]